MMSMSGGWFFVVASEAISVGTTHVALPGMGSYIALAIERGNLGAIAWAILTMLIVILLYDQLLFRPLVAWIDGLRFEQEAGAYVPHSWALTVMRRSRLISAATATFDAAVRWTSWAMPIGAPPRAREVTAKGLGDWLWFGIILAVLAGALWHILRVLIAQTSFGEAATVVELACLTMLRVVVLIALASVVWVPIGVWVGLRPRVMEIVQPIAQFLAAFPANLLFPLAVYVIVTWNLSADVWLSPLMILGTQWYILFNVIAGASTIPGELRYAAQNFQ